MITRNDSAHGGYSLNMAIWLPPPRAEVFAFFADAFQLEAITPPWLRFRVITPAPIDLKAGTLIDYQLRLHGIPIRWRTEISLWEPPFRFVDRQLRGPYRRWVHTHTFEERNGGTLVGDHVDFLSPGGRIVHHLLVGRDVRRIFSYRALKLIERFGGRIIDGVE